MNGMKWIGTAALLLLAGCGGGTDGNDAQPVAAGGGEFQARLQAMTEGERNAVFIRAIRDAGQDCQHVESSAPRGTIQGAPAWTVSCGTSHWAIVIGQGGGATVIDEKDLQQGAPTAG